MLFTLSCSFSGICEIEKSKILVYRAIDFETSSLSSQHKNLLCKG